MAPFDVFFIAGGVFLLLGLFRRDGTLKTAKVERRGVETSERHTYLLMVVVGLILLAVAVVLLGLRHLPAQS